MSAMSAMSPTGLGDLSGAGQEGEEAGEMSPPVQAPKRAGRIHRGLQQKSSV